MAEIYYRDLSLNPTIDSQGDISTLVNRDAIRQSISMLLNTDKGTRIFMPDYGCRIKGFLFEMFDETTANRIGKEIEECINNYEPRVQLINVNVKMIMATSSYDVAVVYKITNTETVDAVKLSLEKL